MRTHLRLVFLASVLVVLQACGARAKVGTAEGQLHVNKAQPTDKVCFLQGGLPSNVEYFVIGKIKGSRKSYGSTDSVLEVMAKEAKKVGADAVIDVDIGQSFGGFMPWSHVRPKGTGIAVRLKAGQKPLDCASMSGKVF